MVSGRCQVVSEKSIKWCPMVSVRFHMALGRCHIESGRCHMVSIRCQMDTERSQMES